MPRPNTLRIVSAPPKAETNNHVTLSPAAREKLAAFIADAVRLRGLEVQPTDATVKRAKASIPGLKRLLDELATQLEAMS